MSSKITLIGARLDLELRQGTTFRRTVTVLQRLPDDSTAPVDLSGSSIRGQVRKAALDPDPAAAAFAVAVTDAAGGAFQLLLTDEQTALLTCGPKITDTASQYEYDVEIEDAAGDVVPLLQGTLRIKAEVTR
jgi:hypothetical protein